MPRYGFEPWLGGGGAAPTPPMRGYGSPDAPPAPMGGYPTRIPMASGAQPGTQAPLTQNYHNYGGPQFNYAPEDLTPFSQYNRGTGTTLSGNVPTYDAWSKQNGYLNDPNPDSEWHDAYSTAMTMGLMNPQQFNDNVYRNRPQTSGLDRVAQGVIGAAAGGIPVGSFVDAAVGPPTAPQYASTGAGGTNMPSQYLPGGGGTAERGQGGGLGGLLGSTVGLIGAGSQQNAYQGYADWARNQGQPYRDALQGSYANPMGYLSSPEVTGAVQQGTDALARSLSMGGNPVGSGGALQQLQNYSTNQQLDRLAQYRQQLGGFGGMNSINQSIPGAAGAAIGAQGNTWNAGGSLLKDIFGGTGGGVNFGSIFGSGVDQFGNPSQGNFQGGPGSPGGGDFYNPGADFGSQFDPNIDWSSLYG